MAICRWACISLKGKLEPYGTGFSGPMPINIKDFLKGKVNFEKNASPFEKYLVGISFDIIAHNNDLSEEIVVGHINGKYYDVEKCNEDRFNISEVFDDFDQYTFDVYNLPGELDNEDISETSDNIFSIDCLYIDPEYRNNRFGTCAIMILPDALKTQFNRDAGYLVSEPTLIFNPDKETKDSNGESVFLEKRLARFWEALGFKTKDTFVYFNTDYDMQRIFIGNQKKK